MAEAFQRPSSFTMVMAVSYTHLRAALKPEAAAVRSCNAALAAEFAKVTAK